MANSLANSYMCSFRATLCRAPGLPRKPPLDSSTANADIVSDYMSRRTGLAALYALLLRIFSLAAFLIGVAFVAFGCVLENPPKQWVSGCARAFAQILFLTSLSFAATS